MSSASAMTGCPDRGGSMVLVDGFCIDATEVRRADYNAWLASNPDPGQQIAVCAANDGFAPKITYEPGSDALPANAVDWCDAQAYCVAMGKRLCGRRGGGVLTTAELNTPNDEWYLTCTQGNTTPFPYGATLQTEQCASCLDPPMCLPSTLGAVGSRGECRGTTAPYDQIYDLSGNVWEWEDACEANSGMSDVCYARGGSFISVGQPLMCELDPVNLNALRSGETPAGTNEKFGIRCCADTVTR